jgi:DHA1 family bicyclomycin/chloramphenicol resistance-like MFS transporter
MKYRFITPLSFFILILGSIVFLPTLSMDIYVPIMPSIAKAYRTQISSIQVTISAFLAGLSIAQLISGILADKYGRKITLLGGIFIYLIMSTTCALTHSITIFTIARLIQGVGCSVTIVCVFAISRDHFKDEKLAKVIAYITAIISLSPVISPVLGSFIDSLVGWRGVFFFLASVGCLLIGIVHFFVKDSYVAQDKQNHKSFKYFILSYGELLKNKTYLKLSLVVTLVYASYFSFLYNAPIIFEEIFSESVKLTGILISINAFALFFGSISATQMLKYLDSSKIVILSFCIITISSILMLFSSFYISYESLVIFCCCMFANTFGVAAIVPMLNSKALSYVSSNFGSAVALSGFVRYAVASLLGVIIAQFNLASIFEIALVFISTVALSYGLIRSSF